LWSGWPESNWR